MTPSGADRPHLPRQTVVNSHGEGGFRFAGMSHRGSILCLPDGIWAWPVTSIEELTEEALGLVFDRARAGALDYFILGTGTVPWNMPAAQRAQFRDAHVALETMTTAPAVRTYNVLLMENRRVGAGLIAVA